jgi:hypothetical protein
MATSKPSRAKRPPGTPRKTPPGPRVPDAIRAFIVRALARYLSLSETVDAVKEHFERVVTRQYVYSLDPSNPHSDVARKWRDLHRVEREKFLSELSSIPIGDQAVRLQRAETLYHNNRRNPVFQKELLEYAAKELGGQFTNARRVDGVVTIEAQLRALANQPDAPPAGPLQAPPARAGLLAGAEVFPAPSDQ